MAKGKEIKAGFGYMIGNMCIKGISFVTLPIFTRLLDPDVFGIYNTYGAYEAILAIILGVGMYSSVKNAQFDFKGKLNSYIATMCSILSCCTGIALLLGIAFNKIITNFTGFLLIVIVLMILQAFGTAALNIANATLSLEYNYKTYLIYAGINTLGNVGLSLLLIVTLFDNDRALGRITGSAVPLFLIGCWILWSYYRKADKKFDRSMAKYAILFGFPLIWHYLAQSVASQFDRIMISSMVGNAETGIYSFVYTIANIFPILFYSTDNVWSVWFYGKMVAKDYVAIKRQSKKYIALVMILATLMMFFSKEIIMVMSSRAYWGSANLFMPIMVGLFFLFLYTIPVEIEYFYKETKYIAGTTIVSALVNILLNWVCIPQFGYKAAAYTTAVSYLVMFFMHWAISRRILIKHNEKPIFDIRIFFAAMIVLVAIAGVIVGVNNNPIIKYSVFFALCVILMIVFRKYIAEHVEKLKLYINKRRR